MISWLRSLPGYHTTSMGVAWIVYATRRISRPTFELSGARFRYFDHRYGHTWLSERSVEVPVVWNVVEAARGKRILEVGNVLSHYHSCEHDVIDKYEAFVPGVHNIDVIDFHPDRPYDLIVSISTIEHVGWDPSGREGMEPQKALQAIHHLRRLLVPRGVAVLTFPIGFHPHLDSWLARGACEQAVFLERVSWTRWQEASWNEVRGARYGAPHLYGNAVAIVTLPAAVS